ncbi:hypothetical protein [uncultured Thalassospira sp.]|jgi:hypothetical protein|uniref:hypothetical protein n=1 Tax=uncultured Thalassospira sp. TaxID=404382 RepID=UPI0030DB3C2F|tara:strand:- start:1494 stop:1727 length:234 start_codon:yes stop_codon:yes gene_type:complete
MRYIDHELSIDEMLADPIVRTLMDYDGITEKDVRKTLARVASARDMGAARSHPRYHASLPQTWVRQSMPVAAPKTAA